MSQLNVDDIYNNAGTGGVTLPAGVSVSGISTFANVDVELQGSTSGITSVTWDASANSLIFKDKSYAKFGDGSDLVIHHDSSNSYITNATGNLNIQAKITEDSIIAKADDAVELYFNGGKKLETTNTGAIITGVITATSFSGDGSALTGVAATDTIAAASLTVSGITTLTTQLEVGSTIQAEAASGIVTAAQFVPTDRFISLGNRRINMNGAMQVWQRSTSASDIGGTNGYFAADRYRSSNNGAGRHTISRDTGEPGGFGHSMKIDVTTAVSSPSANNYMFIQHRMEGQDLQAFAKGTSDAQKYALSFWVKSPKTGVHVVQLEDVENTRSVSGAYTIASADTWEKHTIIFPADTTGGLTSDNDYRMQLYFWLFAGSTYNTGSVGDLATTWGATGNTERASGQVNCFDNTANNFYITGIQFEVGPVATPFEHRSYGQELERCQRYFYMLADGSVQTSAAIADGRFLSGSEVDFMVSFPCTMRTTPSLYQVPGADYFKIMYHTYNAYVDGSWTIQYAQPNACSHYATPDTTGVADKPAQVVLQNAAARLGYSADL